MTTYQADDRPYTAYSNPRPGSPRRDYSPDRQPDIKGPPPVSPYQQHDGPPGHGYPPQPPITPLSGSTYPPQPPPSTGYYGVTSTPADQSHVPSPPLSSASNGRPTSAQLGPDGAPLVPVGVSGGKMFRCRGYGECDKVFTRSEHLARHVRKHTGERPFPCHCGKSFSRLDNLRQHSATVHADQSTLNEAMLSSLAPVHAALSQRANRDQRKRGEVVEVPKNAVERPRHNEQYRKQNPQGPDSSQPYPQYSDNGQFSVPPPPRSRGGYDYQDGATPSISPADDAGPSRRPPSSGYYPPMYYDQASRPPTGQGLPPDNMSHLPYPYRPMSSNGRDLPVPAHYSESEPPTSAHGPPPSPMYPPGPGVPPTAQWSSPPPPHSYPNQSPYPPPADGYQAYPPPPPEHYGGPPPIQGNPHPGYNYPPPPPPPGSYYPSHGYPHPPPPPGQYPTHAPPHPGYQSAAPPHESPFSYSAPPPPTQDNYSYGQPDARKRRAMDSPEDSRKLARVSPTNSTAPQHLNDALNQPRGQPQEPLWLPPTTERRSSLAISALLGSPQQAPRSRPATADLGASQQGSFPGQNSGYGYTAPDVSTGSTSMPATPALNGTPRKTIIEHPQAGAKLDSGVGENMEQKAKALLTQP